MAVSCRMGTLGEGRIQGNPKWKDYYYSPICSQIPAQCLHCRKGVRRMVSYRVKKKLADRTCIYCEKEFQYPYIFKCHKITRCWIEGSMKSNNGSIKSCDG